ncbi:LOW QUALITY PROTEIN: bone morphogenetic protein 3 [Colossoma macropomum]|uniref:LOW QUALITY PROTEIN: bone morphogenetic protein 3 n=1 Tax=Colossoma macropomum TaxID=42526 RepID=UPI001865578E|nr:LOW QUALITY PROTEIN: bone morphogenetic protein 3 [Colossoma macropomum]
MDPCQRLLVLLLLGWSCLSCGLCAMLKDHFAGLAQDADLGHSKKTAQDTVSEHMQMLYAKYNSAGFPLKDGNTVRSFKAQPGTINKKHLQIFNLTSLAKSEDVLSATLHYYIGDLQNSSRSCSRPKSCHHGLRRQAHIHLSIWSFASMDNSTRTLGHFLINISSTYRDFISWQWKDITRVVNQAKHHHELLIGIAIDSQGRQPRKKFLFDRKPYILVYANDSAISEPESVVTTLQRHKGSLVPGLHKLGLRNRNSSSLHRTKRSANILLPLQNNELPGPEYPYKIHTWDETSPYDPIESKPAKRPRKKPRKKQGHKNPLLQFDEQTIKKARKKQWNEPRNCARRYLKVDFADIGWSEWIISPKSFDAYYCSGSCQFPMPKSLKPSNHATIQSIVRAVGVVPGIPEPCCVPEKMSSLSILFFDEDKNVVLKVYPNMTVDSCACR